MILLKLQMLLTYSLSLFTKVCFCHCALNIQIPSLVHVDFPDIFSSLVYFLSTGKGIFINLCLFKVTHLCTMYEGERKIILLQSLFLNCSTSGHCIYLLYLSRIFQFSQHFHFTYTLLNFPTSLTSVSFNISFVACSLL